MNRNSSAKDIKGHPEKLEFSLNVDPIRKIFPQAYKRYSEEKSSLCNGEIGLIGNLASHPKALSRVGIHGAAGIVCLCLMLFGPHFSPMYSLSPGPEQARAQTSSSDNPTGNLEAFAAEFDKDGDGEADAPDEADQAAEEPADEPDEPAEVDDADDDADDDDADKGDERDDRDAESDGEEDASDDARFSDQHDDDGDGGYDIDEGDGPDYAGSAPRGKTGTPRTSLSRLGALSELTPVRN